MSTLDRLRQQLRDVSLDVIKTCDDMSLAGPLRARRLDELNTEMKSLERKIADEEHLEAQHRSFPYARMAETGAGATFGPTVAARPFGVKRPVGGIAPVAFTHDELAEVWDAAISGKNITVETKAALGEANAPMAAVPDYRLTPIPFAREPTRVASLLPASPTSASEVDYFQITTAATAAAAVAEGGNKPQSNPVYAKAAAPIRKLAHYVELTDETLSDFPNFLAVMQTELMAGLVLAENDQLLNGTGVAPALTGILATTGILTRARAADTQLDAFAKSFTDLRTGTSFVEPDGVVMNPADWQTVLTAKDTQNRYLLGAAPSAGSPSR